MRFPFFRKDPGSALCLRVENAPEIHFGVYFRCSNHPPEDHALKETVLAWLEGHAEEPLRSILAAFLDQNFVSLSVHEDFPRPEGGMVRGTEAGERVYAEATHMALIATRNIPAHPHVGLWSGVAAARALALAFGGAALDIATRSLLDPETHAQGLPPDGRITPPEHIVVPSSTDAGGLSWMTTLGMPKFGLPNLEIRDVPPSLTDALLPVVNAAAYRLIVALMMANDEVETPVEHLELPRAMRLSLEDFAAAYGVEAEPAPEGVRGWTMLHLDYTGRGRHGMEPFLAIGPPPGGRARPGEWLYSATGDLYGSESEDDLGVVELDNERMEVAHRRAVETLPDTKRRFAAGLALGQQLFVKRAFPLDDGANEYMWLAVNTWKGDHIRGQLANDPVYRLDLRAGQTVDLTEADVYDWLLSGPGAAIEGNFTERVLREEGETPSG